MTNNPGLYGRTELLFATAGRVVNLPPLANISRALPPLLVYAVHQGWEYVCD
jgi:hypothetical protein